MNDKEREELQGWLKIVDAGISQMIDGVMIAITFSNAALLNKDHTLELLSNMALAMQNAKKLLAEQGEVSDEQHK